MVNAAQPRAYLAGFDVFRPDAKAYGAHLKALCAQCGLDGLFPLDAELPARLSGVDAAAWIFNANKGLIEQADVVIANLNPFRGQEPDSGTAFEVGYAHAKGIAVVAYMADARPMITRLGRAQDEYGFHVEDFGLAANLMLSCASAAVVEGEVQDAIEQAAHLLAIPVSGHQPRLTVDLRSFPESNGRRNWTAMFTRVEPFEGLVGTCGGITIDHGECWNRVAYAAERARVLIGERVSEPRIQAYGEDVATPEQWRGDDPEGVFAQRLMARERQRP